MVEADSRERSSHASVISSEVQMFEEQHRESERSLSKEDRIVNTDVFIQEQDCGHQKKVSHLPETYEQAYDDNYMSAVTAKFTENQAYNKLVDFGYTSNVVYDGGYTIEQNDNGQAIHDAFVKAVAEAQGTN